MLSFESLDNILIYFNSVFENNDLKETFFNMVLKARAYVSTCVHIDNSMFVYVRMRF